MFIYMLHICINVIFYMYVSIYIFIYVYVSIGLYVKYIMQNARLDEVQAGIKIAGENISNLRYVDDTILWQKVKRSNSS